MKCFIILIQSFFLNAIFSQDIKIPDFDNDSYFISSIAIYRSKAYLALPRSVCFNNITDPTLVEISWYSVDIFSTYSRFQVRNRIFEHQKWGNCDDIQDAVSVDVEQSKHKLWVLDKGNDLCTPKIVSYNLFYLTVVDKIELKDVPRKDLSTLIIQKKFDENGSKAYVGNAGMNTLLVVSLNDLKWWKLQLLSENNYQVLTIQPDFLTLSKTKQELFMTGKNDLNLFSLNLEKILNPNVFNSRKQLVVNVSYLGEKLGYSSGLETDYKSGLSYYLVRDFAIVRWLIGSPPKAEYYNVLGQSYEKLPYVANLFTDPLLGLWALVNPFSPNECKEYAKNESFNDIPKIKQRFVKILKYNKLVKDIETDGI